jgi:hypothetical protein
MVKDGAFEGMQLEALDGDPRSDGRGLAGAAAQ